MNTGIAIIDDIKDIRKAVDSSVLTLVWNLKECLPVLGDNVTSIYANQLLEINTQLPRHLRNLSADSLVKLAVDLPESIETLSLNSFKGTIHRWPRSLIFLDMKSQDIIPNDLPDWIRNCTFAKNAHKVTPMPTRLEIINEKIRVAIDLDANVIPNFKELYESIKATVDYYTMED